MLYPLLPTFVTGKLGAPVVALGVAEGLAEVQGPRPRRHARGPVSGD
jgi:hypothetical protein